jgi:hypothetical protein
MKKILFGIFLPCVFLSFLAENGKLSGAVTFRDSYESSSQADVGSEIYAINEADVKSTQYNDIKGVLESFQRNKSQYSVSIYNTIDPVRIKNAQDYFNTVSNFTFKYLSGLKQLPAIVKTKTDGAGNYSLNLRPGKYYVLVISSSVKSNNLTESRGNIDYRIVDVKPEGGTFLNVTFEKPENILNIFITGGQQTGC